MKHPILWAFAASPAAGPSFAMFAQLTEPVTSRDPAILIGCHPAGDGIVACRTLTLEVSAGPGNRPPGSPFSRCLFMSPAPRSPGFRKRLAKPSRAMTRRAPTLFGVLERRRRMRGGEQPGGAPRHGAHPHWVVVWKGRIAT